MEPYIPEYDLVASCLDRNSALVRCAIECIGHKRPVEPNSYRLVGYPDNHAVPSSRWVLGVLNA